MKTPISFILDLILDYELPADAQKVCRKYVRELEGSMQSNVVSRNQQTKPIHGAIQAPSTQRLLDEMAAQTGAPLPIVASQQAAKAMESRQAAINQALSGLPEKGRTSPKKF